VRALRRLLARWLAFVTPGRNRKRRRAMHYLFTLSCALLALPLAAQSDAIQDNSLLIEEAYNQEAGVVQHIQTFSRAARGGDWLYTLTEEWPAPSLKHQLSYTLPFARIGEDRGAGDVALNYRYQWIGDGDSPLAVSPRVTLLMPTGSSRRGFGSGALGWQAMLPVSTVLRPSVVAHWNLGATLTPATRSRSVVAGQSLVWLARPRFNVLVETLWTRTSDRAGHETQLTVSPGIRWSYDLPHHLQVVPGRAVPITYPHGARSLFLYLSFEHPFRSRGTAARRTQPQIEEPS
jgi:hypothetical protein